MSRTDQPGRTLDRFEWFSEKIANHPHIRTLDRIKSLSGGVAAVLEILEADQLNSDDDLCFGSVLTGTHKGDLLRLAIEASRVISDECERAFDWAEKFGTDLSKPEVD